MHSLSRFFRRAALLGLLPFMASASASAPVTPDRHHQVVAQVSYLLMENFHLAGRPIDSAVAEAWLDGHIDALDPDRLFFTASDIATFRAMIPDLPDGAHRVPADVSPAFKIHARYQQRVSERVQRSVFLFLCFTVVITVLCPAPTDHWPAAAVALDQVLAVNHEPASSQLHPLFQLRQLAQHGREPAPGDRVAGEALVVDGGVVVDVRRAGGLGDDDWWLAIYVMLSRARQLTNLILVGFREQVEDLLRRGPPTRLIYVTEMLEQRAQITLATYSWLIAQK